MNPFKFIDLFAGIGGMRIPFERLGRACLKGGTLKVWANKVAVSASGGKVRLPLNHPDFKDRWLDSQFAEGRKASITTAKPGEIVQIEWKEGIGDPHNLHTLIVVSVGPQNITFIDSNWHGDEMVGKRTRSISIFEGDNAWAESFTIYTIK